MSYQLLLGDCIDVLKTLEAGSVQTCVTSPPYFGLRDYGHEGQIGLEETPELYVEKLVEVFRQVRRVLHPTGVIWVNLGDSYNGSGTMGSMNSKQGTNVGSHAKPSTRVDGLKPKDLIGIPWLVAFALRADGWYLRSDIIWHKPNPMPESVTDRPTKAHEYIFLLSKSAQYFYDADAIREPHAPDHLTNKRGMQWGSKVRNPHGNGKSAQGDNFEGHYHPLGRNRRSVWTVTTKPFSGTKLMTDYVGDDGKPYIASPDCPIHGHLARSRKSYTVGYGEQPDQPLHHNHSNGADHDPLHVVSQDAMTSRNHSDADAESVRPQTLGSIDDCKSGVDHLEHTSGAQSLSRTSHTSESHDGQDCKTDSVDPSCSPIASDHSTQMSRTDHVRPTLRHGNASVQTDNHTQNIPLFEGLFDSADHRHENNTSVSDSSDIQATQTDSRNVGIETASASFVAFVTSTKNYTCTCQECKIDHFATFPPDLIEPCILAGSSAHGCCAECGAPWARVVEREPDNTGYANGPGGHKRYQNVLNGGNGSSTLSDVARYNVTTLGWQPTCTCECTDVVPCTVLDPFSGSGTSGAVALKHGRNYIGIDLNADYLELAHKRIQQSQPTLLEVHA